jgi:hypothetical protein
MRVVTVESSTLATVAYDETREILQLGFCNGAVYQYSGVPAAVQDALLVAPSKGRYFNQAIRNRFPCRLIPDSATIAPNAAAQAGRRR